MSCKQVAEMLKVHILLHLSLQLAIALYTLRPIQAGKLHICAKGWTSPNVISFVRLTIHWVGKGQIQSTILDFVKYIYFILSQLHVCLHN
jgi:hypothetical protein